MEKVKSMMTCTKLGYESWVEVVETIVYLKNRSPYSSIEGTIAQEMRSGKKVRLDH